MVASIAYEYGRIALKKRMRWSLRNVWLVYTIEVYDLIIIYLHTPHTIPNKLAIKLACVAVCHIHLNGFLCQLLQFQQF
eukprot:SAG25_NODE_197_length_12126_cov_39.030515_2_plen_79_part_00